MTQIKNIKEVTEPLKEKILKGTRRSRLFSKSLKNVHTIEEMKAWLKSFGNSNIDRINAIRKEVLYKEMER